MSSAILAVLHDRATDHIDPVGANRDRCRAGDAERGRAPRAPPPIRVGVRQVLADIRDPPDTDDVARPRHVASAPRRSLIRRHKPIGPHVADWLAMDLNEVKQVRKRLGGSLNDVVLTTVTGAVQRFLEGRRVHVDFLDFRVMAPVSVRSAEEKGTLGNRVSAWIIELPLAERNPRTRLEKISETTARLKETKQALGAEMLSRVAEWTPSTLLSLASSMMTRALPFNLVVTNVPGPQVPLYLLGAKMLDNYGQVPLTDYLGLGIVLFSYAGKLCWGFNADWDLVPDLKDFVTAVADAFRELQQVAGAPTSLAGAAGPNGRPHAAPPAVG
jgi:WS/DGAT/MGAT family acyltransferase